MALVYWYVRDFFNFIGTIISSIFFIIWELISVLINIVVFLGDLFIHLPIIISAPATIIVIVSVLYKVLGREGGH